MITGLALKATIRAPIPEPVVPTFHALRMTFITNLTQSGVSPKTAQVLARHCDINLTMNTYTMLGVMDTAAAVEGVSRFPRPAP